MRVSPRHSTHLVFDAPLRPGGVEVNEPWVKKAVNEARQQRERAEVVRVWQPKPLAEAGRGGWSKPPHRARGDLPMSDAP